MEEQHTEFNDFDDDDEEYYFGKRQILERIVSFLDLSYNCRKIDIGSFYYNEEDRKCRLLAINVFLCRSRSGSSPNAAGAA